jgi:YD repeat-containing protein
MIRDRARVAVVGDFDPSNRTHRFTCDALEHVDDRLSRFDGLWIAPASPYRSMDGALTAIRYARERGVPLVGT